MVGGASGQPGHAQAHVVCQVHGRGNEEKGGQNYISILGRPPKSRRIKDAWILYTTNGWGWEGKTRKKFADSFQELPLIQILGRQHMCDNPIGAPLDGGAPCKCRSGCTDSGRVKERQRKRTLLSPRKFSVIIFTCAEPGRSIWVIIPLLKLLTKWGKFEHTRTWHHGILIRLRSYLTSGDLQEALLAAKFSHSLI